MLSMTGICVVCKHYFCGVHCIIKEMAELKTQPTSEDVAAFFATLDDGQRQDSEKLTAMMQDIMGEPPVMWGSSIVGFGSTHLVYASGRELDWMKIGFSPRKGKLSIYGSLAIADYAKDLEKLGKHKTGKGCLYITKLADVNMDVLEKIIRKLAA